jgi:hypothetical protein
LRSLVVFLDVNELFTPSPTLDILTNESAESAHLTPEIHDSERSRRVASITTILPNYDLTTNSLWDPALRPTNKIVHRVKET